MIDKRWAYEESLRIPFLIRHPEVVPRGPADSDRLVLNIDLAPTLLDLAGLEVPAYMQGRSLRPLLEDPQTHRRDAFYYNDYREAPFPAPTVHAIRTERYKYIEYDAKKAKLYDLMRDSREESDLLETEEGKRLRESPSRRLRTFRTAARRDGVSRAEGVARE